MKWKQSALRRAVLAKTAVSVSLVLGVRFRALQAVSDAPLVVCGGQIDHYPAPHELV